MQPISVDLVAESTLTLDGVGTRCEQLIRVLTSPDVSKRPPEFAQLDAVGATGRCLHDDLLDRDIVRVFAPLYGGKPIFQPTQDAIVNVTADNRVVFLHGDFLPAGVTPAAACRSTEEIAASIPGRQIGYTKFASCLPDGDGTYTVASNDVIEVGDEGFALDDEGKLRRVRAVDVFLTPDNITPEIINSDSYCCQGLELDRCVGKRMFVDAVTGELIATHPNCHTC